MCTGPGTAHPTPVIPAGQDAPWQGEVIPLEPVDSVAVTTICDNFIDIWLVDEGPARRLLSRGGEPPYVPVPTLEGGKGIGQPHVEHGFSAHVEITKAGHVHRLLFDCGMTPGGCAETSPCSICPPPILRQSSAATATSITPRGSPACSGCWAGPACRS